MKSDPQIKVLRDVLLAVRKGHVIGTTYEGVEPEVIDAALAGSASEQPCLSKTTPSDTMDKERGGSGFLRPDQCSERSYIPPPVPKDSLWKLFPEFLVRLMTGRLTKF